MREEIRKVNEEKIFSAYSTDLKIHLKLKDKSWRNGYVKQISSDFFIFVDDVNGKEAIFFLEVIKVEPCIDEGRWEK